MGLIRKIASVSTFGAIDFRSAKDRTAAYARGTRTQARKQTKIMEQATKASHSMRGQRGRPAGWYADGSLMRYWDGLQWTPYTRESVSYTRRS
jgi:hypothetical protein